MDKAYKTTFTQLSDMKNAVGQELGLSEWFVVEQERINTFASATVDEQWIHIDVERSAKESPYKQTIAHGFLILSLTPKFTSETYSIEDAKMGVNYGTDKVRFMNATPAGASIRGRTSLLSYEEKEGGAKLKVKIEIEIQGQSKPACVAELIAIIYN